MFHPSNRFIIHECLSFYYFELWKICHPRKPIYHPQEVCSFIWGCGNLFIHETDLSSTRAFFGFTRGLWKTFHPQNWFVIYESLFFFSFGLWKIRVKFVWSSRAVIGIAVVFLLLPSHRRPCFAPLPRTVCSSLLSLRLSFRQPFPSTSCDISSQSQ